MPRTSDAAAAAMSSAVPAEGIAPPKYLSPEEGEEWRSIVSGLQAGHFDSANAPLLVQLCRHVIIARQLAEQLATMRHARLTLTSARGSRQRDVFCQLLKAKREESRLIMSLSVKLRLANSSYRLNPTHDERALRVVPGPRPWEGH